jgi:tRNA pseudouridine38-40 synthase
VRNIALRLMYDGTNYHGWQVQKNEITVAETLERALTKICGAPTKLTGCGRTDAGVHALRYCANFRTDATIPTDRVPLAVNALIPPDIAVVDAVDAPEDFNAILSCEKKEYTYKIYNARIRNPMYVNRAHFCPVPLELEAMQQAAAAFCGTRDFAAVRSVGTEVKSTVRTVHYCEVSREGSLIELRICADGFLYNMVRAITGTVIYAGLGKILPEDIENILQGADRRLAGPTAPPQGLYMTKLWYSGEVGRMMDKNL